MIALRTVIHFITGEPVDRDTRRARLLAAPRKPIGSITRRGIFHPAATRHRPVLSRMCASEATGGVNPTRCCSSPAAMPV
ncbi:hypothetical protein U1708_19875 [Sphingomonas sp. ZB1N12]|jgi:hypothetical protein|uniref:hypothetical protein n=1 Tax=Sphingomonas TaxID=13687 RepID=UPI0016162D65|nr:hypothetical protein [Sphingomonas sp. BK481]MBB3589573.1 hypothetical protein [Sphingomonas sp. BK481]